ncbi:hypothetical protein QEN19_003144 [Hanseniaspora menglaensis]
MFKSISSLKGNKVQTLMNEFCITSRRSMASTVILMNKTKPAFQPSEKEMKQWFEELSNLNDKLKTVDTNKLDVLYNANDDVELTRARTFSPTEQQLQDLKEIPENFLPQRTLDYDLEQVINLTMSGGNKLKSTKTIMQALKLLQLKVYKDNIKRGNNSLEPTQTIVPELPIENAFKNRKILHSKYNEETDVKFFKQKAESEIPFEESKYTMPCPVTMLKYCLTQLGPVCKTRGVPGPGGKRLLIPRALNRRQRNYMAWKWILEASWKRQAREQSIRLYEELLKVYNGTSPLYAKRDLCHVECIQNRGNTAR